MSKTEGSLPLEQKIIEKVFGGHGCRLGMRGQTEEASSLLKESEDSVYDMRNTKKTGLVYGFEKTTRKGIDRSAGGMKIYVMVVLMTNTGHLAQISELNQRPE